MPISEPQQQTLKDWIRSKAVVQCPACRDSKWRFAEAAYVRALLEPGEVDLTEAGGGSEAPVRQLRVRGALRRRDGGNSGIVGQGEGLITSQVTVPAVRGLSPIGSS